MVARGGTQQKNRRTNKRKEVEGGEGVRGNEKKNLLIV